MSFASNVKQEISKHKQDDCCQKAMLAAMIQMNGTLGLSSNGITLNIQTENASIAKTAYSMIKSLYDTETELVVSKKMKLKKNNIYILKVKRNALDILQDLHIYEGTSLQSKPNEDLFVDDCCKKSYLAGAFLSSGSVNSPEKSSYHLEITTSDLEHSQFLQDLINEREMNAKMIQRRNLYVIYLKSSEKITELMMMMGAINEGLNFENIRMTRDYLNSINRINNMEVANEMKVQAAATKQVSNIALIKDQMGFEGLDEKLRPIAQLRLDNEDASLNELCELYFEQTGVTMSKSGMNHRIRKLNDIAKGLMKN